VRLRFIGPEEMCEVFGHVFIAGEWEEAERLDPDHAATLSRNPTFEHEPASPADGAIGAGRPVQSGGMR
jgi:hypothetical protein